MADLGTWIGDFMKFQRSSIRFSLLLAGSLAGAMLPGFARDSDSSVDTISRVSPIQMSPARIKKAKETNVPTVTQTIVVKATPKYVFEAIQHARKAESTRKLLSYDGSDATIEEKFRTIPVVGEATCTYVEHEIPGQGIEYHLVNSDRFTVFQGRWSLTPGRDGKSTVLELSNAMDPGIRIPFWQEITKMAAGKSVKKRLDEVNLYALTLQSAAGSTTEIR